MKMIWARVRREAAMLWAFFSVRVAAAFAVLAGWLVADPAVLTQLVGYVPEYWRPVAGVLAGLVAFAVPVIARRMPQAGLKGPGDDLA
jgi:hypothetical protein